MHGEPFPEHLPYLIVANSGRALACSAKRGGCVVHVVDGFADMDTRHWARSVTRVPWERGQVCDRMSPSAVAQVARALGPVRGVIYGAGFESAPEHVQDLADVGPLLGNSPAQVAWVKHPERLATLLHELRIPHPAWQREKPADARLWLCKTAGAAGGTHVRSAEAVTSPGEGDYFQRHMDGRSVSALFLANGQQVRVVGYHEQWVSGNTQGAFYAYGGACSDARLDPDMRAAMTSAIERLVSRVGLRGLNGVDFIVDDRGFWLIEVNPRPCITIDLYDPDWWEGLFYWHVQACMGKLPDQVPMPGVVRAHRLVYAPADVSIDDGTAWPDWVTDQPARPAEIPTGMPVCTIHAEAPDAASAWRLLASRTSWLMDRLLTMRTGSLI